ncbi:MAG TPA: hypothetical protein VK854_14315 [Woeseiaceae bacterium]|nr:hypothetical protein [Woeseiaceae bacterium]
MKVWQELRRRRVFRLAGLYVVGAWLVIQVADISFPAWGLPETSLRYLFIAAMACFPVALVFGWFYDVTPQGIVRTEPAGEAESVDLNLKRADYVVLAALLVVGIAIVAGSVGKIQDEIETGASASARAEKSANSIAVLPFANLDTRSETVYFSDGITEEILHRLSTMRVLHVLASTSSFAFRGSDETPASISDKLGVRYLLQGSVRRDGEQVRVTARLVDEEGFQVWSDTFDRKLERIFVIQTEIASKVASEIVNEIVPPKELPEGRTTDNMEAYNAYLRGKAYFEARTAAWKDEADAAFSEAIELDPDFAPPYAGKAMLVVNSSPGEQWQDARGLAEKALELDPSLPPALAILGLTQSVLGEYEQALESLRKAIDLDPSLAIAYQWITMPLRRLARHDEARAMAERGLEIDPLNPVLIRNAVGRESLHGNFERAEGLLLRLTGLPEPPGWAYLSLYNLYSEWGRYGQAIEAARDEVRRSAREDDKIDFDLLVHAYASVGMVEDADYWFRQVRAQSQQAEPPIHLTNDLAELGAAGHWLSQDLEMVEKLLPTAAGFDKAYLLTYGGLAQIQAGNFAKGIDWLERGIVIYEQDMADDPPDKIDYSLLDEWWFDDVIFMVARAMAFACAEAGRDAERQAAMRHLERKYEWLPEPTNPLLLQSKAETRVLSGDFEAALGHLQAALELGWANYYELVNRPVWAEAIKSSAFQAVLRETKANVETQRKIVEAADAEHDFRAEAARLVSAKTETE